jgi:hypothetical protein
MKIEELTGSMEGTYRAENNGCAGYGVTILEAQTELQKAIKMNNRRMAYRTKHGK